MTKWEIKNLLKRLDELGEKQPERRRPLLSVEGQAWFYWCLEHLSEDEATEFKGVVEQLNKLDEHQVNSKDPESEKIWNERMRLLHRFGELEKLGESRAPIDASWLEFLAKFRDEERQIAKVHGIDREP